MSKFFWLKTCENVTVLHCFDVDNFDFARKIVEIFWLKTRENVWGCFTLLLPRKKRVPDDGIVDDALNAN